jgi:hypothetical protein
MELLKYGGLLLMLQHLICAGQSVEFQMNGLLQ